MKYKSIVDVKINHDELGIIEPNQVFEATDAQIGGIKRFVEPYNTKVVDERPKQASKRTTK